MLDRSRTRRILSSRDEVLYTKYLTSFGETESEYRTATKIRRGVIKYFVSCTRISNPQVLSNDVGIRGFNGDKEFACDRCFLLHIEGIGP
jgi:hypothetical protein